MQPDRARHATASKVLSAAGFGLGRIRHVAPFHTSARVWLGASPCSPTLKSPTAMQNAGRVHDTPATFHTTAGTASGVARQPAGRHASLPAEQKLAVGHDTCVPVMLELLSVHLVPFHLTAPLPPTAMQNEALTQDTSAIAGKPNEACFTGGCASRQVVPFHPWAITRVLSEGLR